MKSAYNTKQRSAVLSCFEENADGQFTIDELMDALGGNAPGKSTVYRLVKKLEEEGMLRRFTREGTSKAVYQLAGTHCCSEHLHIKCVDCGLLIHLDHETQDEFTKSTGFVIDDSLSMLYGRCAECARRSR